MEPQELKSQKESGYIVSNKPLQDASASEKETPSAPGVREFQKACEAGQDLFGLRNTQYGNAIEETGVLGASVELVGCVARIKQLVIRSGDAGKSNRDDLIDILKDIHNYANIALMMLAKDNWRGDR